MKEKITGELQEALMQEANLDAYISENRDQFQDWDIAELLVSLYKQKSFSKAAVARRGGMSEVYLHQVFAGRRRPSRDRLICICIGMDATLDETQELLKKSCYAPLYPKNKRDAILAHGIAHRTAIECINDNLYTANEKTLY